jgi:hypothetical protein
MAQPGDPLAGYPRDPASAGQKILILSAPKIAMMAPIKESAKAPGLTATVNRAKTKGETRC